jgi:hypothetical protein
MCCVAEVFLSFLKILYHRIRKSEKRGSHCQLIFNAGFEVIIVWEFVWMSRIEIQFGILLGLNMG